MPRKNGGMSAAILLSVYDLIYHNICLPHRSGRVRREYGACRVKPAEKHPVNRAACA